MTTTLKQVAVTGLGVVCPLGNNVEKMMTALFALESGTSKVTHFDASPLSVNIAAEVKQFPRKQADIKLDFALSAAAQAMQQAVTHPLSRNERTQLAIGIGLELFSMPDLVKAHSNNKTLEQLLAVMPWHERLSFINTPSDLAAHMISHEYQMTLAPEIHISACAASTDAIGRAFEAIRYDRADFILAGGTDSMINPMGMGGFARIGALSQCNDSPEAASRPFDIKRNGFVLGEGAGFMAMESVEHAQSRGAKILALISGYGNSLDAFRISDPRPDGTGALSAMQRALKSANMAANQLSAISAHGTGTEKNDVAETTAIRDLLADRADHVPVFASKSMLGHLIAASGVVETIAVIQSLQQQHLHATLNLEQIDPHCQLNHVTKNSQTLQLDHILKNSFGFGGKNACLIASHYKP